MLVKNTSDFHSAYYLESSGGVVNEKIRIPNNCRAAVFVVSARSGTVAHNLRNTCVQTVLVNGTLSYFKTVIHFHIREYTRHSDTEFFPTQY
jgi:hypothetical protein